MLPLSNIHILHEDAGVLVVNKPTLLLSVPGRADDNKDCLITRLQENGYPEARIVHRLDWETSGIILLARDADTHREQARDQAQYRKGEEQDGDVNQDHQLGQRQQGGEAEVGDSYRDQGEDADRGVLHDHVSD